MGGTSLPPGFRFHPTDEELVGYYLKRKVEGLEIELEVIPVVELYKFDPWELPDKSFLPKRDMEWFFFCPRDKKYPNGFRTNRATRAGYWKATGKDRKIVCQDGGIGYRKTLVFYRGRAPMGNRTDWVMHEYRLSNELTQNSPDFQGAFALCRVIKRAESTVKTGDARGEPKAKIAKSSSSIMETESTSFSNEPIVISGDASFQASQIYDGSNFSSPNTSPYQLVSSTAENEPFSFGKNPNNLWVSPDFIFDSSKDHTQGQYFPQYELQQMTSGWSPYNEFEISPTSSYSNFREEFDHGVDLSRLGYMSPNSENANYMGLFGNEDMPYDHFNL